MKSPIICKYSSYHKLYEETITFYFRHLFVDFGHDYTRMKQCDASTLTESQVRAFQRLTLHISPQVIFEVSQIYFTFHVSMSLII